MLFSWMALLAGAILALAFAPLHIYSFAFLSPALLCYLWIKSTPKQASWLGFLFGLGFFGVGVSWVSVSIHNFGNVAMWLTWLVTLGFVAFLSLFILIPGYCFSRFFSHKPLAIQCLCVFPALWLISEYLRSVLLTGLPWLLLGYSQTVSFLQGYAPIFGTYGLSLCAVFLAGSLTLLLLSRTLTERLIGLSVILLTVIPSWFLHGKVWAHAKGDAIKASLIQGNFDQFLKWDSHTLQTILDTYLKLSKDNLDSQIIVWPEAAIPYYPSQLPNYMDQINTLGQEHNITFILGAPTFEKSTQRYFNSLFMMGNQQGQYNKQRLVPFGEYTPWGAVINPFLASFSIPMSNFSPGNSDQPSLTGKHFTIAPFICYEIIYPQFVIKHINNNDLIVVINDDGWFGRSMALSQHLQMAQMAAQETNRYVLFCSNTGITAIINPLGEVLNTAPIDQQAVVSGTVYAMQGKTPLMDWGYYPVMTLTLLLLLLAVMF